MGKLGYTAAPIRDERKEADRIKLSQPILAIIGNPPYWRFEGVNSHEIVGRFVEGLWEDLKAPVRDAGWANQLNTFPEFSIAFWRWALWKLFEADNAPQKGVITFISNRTFLAGKPYAGLRKMLRERFDRIEIIDLRGDLRKGARAGVHGDTGVFNIKVGTAITLAIADGSKAEGALAEVTYTDTWEEGLFPREAKLQWLQAGARAGTRPGGVPVNRAPLDPLRPPAFGSVNWPPLSAIFGFFLSGLQTKRDHFIYAVVKPRLIERLRDFKDSDDDEARLAFHDSRDRKWNVARAQPIEEHRVIPAAYRPLDRRYLYNHPAFGDFLRPSLQQAWGASNVGLYAMPFGTGSGPAVWCHSLLPDYHSFSGRGGYAFPLYDRRPGHGPLNISSELLDNLALAFASPVAPDDAFDAILALLSASSYTLRFAEDLEDAFPHVPFPADRAVFERAAKVGAAIRELETFARPPNSAHLPSSLASFETTPNGRLAPSEWDDGMITLCKNGSGKVIGIPAAVWDFAVSGYRVLPRWLTAREGLQVDHAFVKEFRDINGRINELIHHFDAADLVLQEALKHSLTRDELGLAPAPSEDEDEQV
ncbi:MAG TPA: type ISP restriction/modification enzyme [Allosphingosinicella sp.]|nr:type ISP restriction/modification enzyme [Allosphingosinicella sp.]